jgi:hypothetical protein
MTFSDSLGEYVENDLEILRQLKCLKNHEIYSSKEILEIKLNVQERIVFLLDELISLKNQSSELILICNNGAKDEHLYIGIHRKNCNTYKAQVSDCKEQIYNFESGKKRCEEICHSIRTDYSTGCECKPYLDIDSLIVQLNSIDLVDKAQYFNYLLQS